MPDDIEISRPYKRALGTLGDEHRGAGTEGSSLLAGCLIGHIEPHRPHWGAGIHSDASGKGLRRATAPCPISGFRMPSYPSMIWRPMSQIFGRLAP